MARTIRFFFDYAAGDAPVVLTVTIGDGQVGGSSVRLDGVAVGEPGRVERLPIGDGPALVGRRLVIRTGVIDINPSSDRTSVSYDLNGDLPGALRARAEVDEDGGAIVYETTITFVAPESA